MSHIERYITRVNGGMIPIEGDDIDTDRIIPARFMKGITFDGLGEFAFYDERFDMQGNRKSHPFNDERFNGNSLLLVGRNFGCGSSREHAPQALMRYGIRAIIGISFADIFAGNCTQIGLPTVRISSETLTALLEIVKGNPGVQCSIDLEKKLVSAGTAVFPFTIDDSACNALVSGLWDTTSLLLKNRDLIMSKAESLPY